MSHGESAICSFIFILKRQLSHDLTALGSVLDGDRALHQNTSGSQPSAVAMAPEAAATHSQGA